MSQSSLISKTMLSPHFTTGRAYPISKITIHHAAMVGASASTVANAFLGTRSVSATYCVGNDGEIIQSVLEENRPWTSSNYDNDNRAITIEIANSAGEPDWKVSDTCLESTIKLMVDVCKRNGISRLNYTGDATGNFTMHQYFTATRCPGEYMVSIYGDIATEVNKRLSTLGSTTTTTTNVEDEEFMTSLEKFKDMFGQMMEELKDNDASIWSDTARDWAEDKAIVLGDNATSFNGQWEKYITREEAVTLLYRLSNLLVKYGVPQDVIETTIKG